MKGLLGMIGILMLVVITTHGVPTNRSTGFNSLDNYALLNVYDHLDFDNLLNVAGVNVKNRELISRHYMIAKYRINEKIIRIANIAGRTEDANTANSVDIFIVRSESAALFLQHFGHLITKLQIDSDVRDYRAITKSIDEHCSKTFVELTIIGSADYFLIETSAIFTKLTKLAFEFPISTKKIQNLSKIYPALEELTISSEVTTEYYGIQEYQHFLNDLRDRGNGICTVLQSVHQLRALTISEIPEFRIIECIHDHQPALESLSIKYNWQATDSHFGLDSTPTEFNNMHSLAIEDPGMHQGPIVLPIRSSRLENLEIRINKTDGIPLKTIQQNVGLKSLSMPTWYEMNDLLSILDGVKETHSIEEVTVVWSSAIDRLASTKRLLNEYPALKRVTFIVLDLDSDRDALMTVLPTESGQNQWNIINEETCNRPPRLCVTVERAN